MHRACLRTSPQMATYFICPLCVYALGVDFLVDFLTVLLGLGVAFLAVLLGVFLVVDLGVLAAAFLPELAGFLVAAFFT